jgi:hypothetical protein
MSERKAVVKKIKNQSVAEDIIKQLDRVWMSIERKYKVVDYESLTINIGVSSSLEPNESISDATQRVFKEIREEFTDITDIMKEQEEI